MNDNVIPFKVADKEPKLPNNDYLVVDINNEEFDVNGFLVFTTHHIAVMKEVDGNSIPSFVLPLHRLDHVELIDDEGVDTELPF